MSTEPTLIYFSPVIQCRGVWMACCRILYNVAITMYNFLISIAKKIKKKNIVNYLVWSGVWFPKISKYHGECIPTIKGFSHKIMQFPGIYRNKPTMSSCVVWVCAAQNVWNVVRFSGIYRNKRNFTLKYSVPFKVAMSYSNITRLKTFAHILPKYT